MAVEKVSFEYKTYETDSSLKSETRRWNGLMILILFTKFN
jgi:hypothetical protein